MYQQNKVGSMLPAAMSQVASLFQTISWTLEISSSRWRWGPAIGCLVCLFVVGCDQRDHLSLPLMWGLSDLKWEHRHGWTSQVTYASFSIITATSYQMAGNKIIIKDICCGDLSFIIAQASKNASGLLRPVQQWHKRQYGCCKFHSDKTKWLSSHR